MKHQNQAIQNFWDRVLQSDSCGGKAVCVLNKIKKEKLTFTL